MLNHDTETRINQSNLHPAFSLLQVMALPYSDRYMNILDVMQKESQILYNVTAVMEIEYRMMLEGKDDKNKSAFEVHGAAGFGFREAAGGPSVSERPLGFSGFSSLQEVKDIMDIKGGEERCRQLGALRKSLVKKLHQHMVPSPSVVSSPPSVESETKRSKPDQDGQDSMK